MVEKKFEIRVPATALRVRVDACLTELLAGEFSRQEIKRAILRGDVDLNGKKARPKDSVREGDVIRGTLDVRVRATLEPEDIPVSVIYEDKNLLVVDKPVGMVVHPGAGHKKGTLAHALLGRGSKLSDAAGQMRPGIVHRLDKDTSGLLLVAKDNASHRFLQDQFAARTLSKTYLALLKGHVEFEEGHIDTPIGHDPRHRDRMAVARDGRGREAMTRYRVTERFKGSTLVQAKPESGRTHQIRVHFASIGHPVVGDALYGDRLDRRAGRLGLHAWKLAFTHPKSGKIMDLESPVPADFKELIGAARGGLFSGNR